MSVGCKHHSPLPTEPQIIELYLSSHFEAGGERVKGKKEGDKRDGRELPP